MSKPEEYPGSYQEYLDGMNDDGSVSLFPDDEPGGGTPIICAECRSFPCRHSMACCTSSIGPKCQHQTPPSWHDITGVRDAHTQPRAAFTEQHDSNHL